MTTRVALITGAARRIGAVLATSFHGAGYNVILHYLNSEAEAIALQTHLNQLRNNSATLLQADLTDTNDWGSLALECTEHWGRIDVLVNNASVFYPTLVGNVTVDMWQELIGSNLRAPFFLSQALIPALNKSTGNIINIVDIHAEKPLKDYPVYSIAKAGLAMLTQSLAKELAPHIRVNGVAPGTILWPEDKATLSESAKENILNKVPLGRQGTPEDIARTVLFLADDAPYITGQIINVDGGRSV